MVEREETIVDNDQAKITINPDAAPQHPGVIALHIRRIPGEPEVEVFLTRDEATTLGNRLLALIANQS